MRSTTHTVTTTASEIITSSASARYVYLHVVGNGTVYLGDSTVTSTTGLQTQKNTTPIEFFIPRGNSLWAVTASATEDLRILQEGGA